MTDNIAEKAMELNKKIHEQNGIKIQGGKVYTKVAHRIEAFRKTIGYDYGIETEFRQLNGGYACKCTIKNPDGFVIGCGSAYSANIQKEKSFEKMETTAIGRALASLGLGGDEYASVEEIDSYDERYQPPTQNAPEDKKTGKEDKTTPEQKWLLDKQKEVGAIHVKEQMEIYFNSDDVKEGIKKLSDEQKKWFEELKKKAIARVSKLADAEFDLIANGIERADTVENLLAAKEKYELAKPRMNDTQIKLIDDVIKRIESKIN